MDIFYLSCACVTAMGMVREFRVDPVLTVVQTRFTKQGYAITRHCHYAGRWRALCDPPRAAFIFKTSEEFSNGSVILVALVLANSGCHSFHFHVFCRCATVLDEQRTLAHQSKPLLPHKILHHGDHRGHRLMADVLLPSAMTSMAKTMVSKHQETYHLIHVG